ncbi:MAG: hypothetical protein PHV81_00605 [Candidatus Methanomethylophilaceae archaeon]|jgi:lysylphosphatidylglycerol synthetase-like protein (DUF2156 family)|nr:hypothetical protein [Candidatus Methanomethylophilaceae archaeon]MDD3350915.1 hypothetical protein [Candidatus Methanomethylophilaceae archaeon]MDD3986597.1 hypothetical protein [Candidatus Methanomethylophilaceae archaeon]MDD4708501.1 hypothetical protein [Candidatus Methanomethylophilaceae archaeon]MDY0251605.1 hypothetical protein [Candidatus Methanomethylophilaceae archaeon]
MPEGNYNRPILLSIFAVLQILGGIIAVAVGAFAILGGAISVPVALPAGLTMVVAGVISLVAGLIMMLVGVALFSGKKWGWWFAVIMTALALIFSLVTLNWIVAVFEAIVLLYLNMKNTKGWFGI